MKSQLWDVVIIGGGPAGAICARELAGSGHRVLVVDKHRFPRHKACGDLLIPDSLGVLERVGLMDRVLDQALRIDKIRVFSPSRVEFGVAGRYLAIKRYDFDSLLMHAALEAGGMFAHGAVVSVEPSESEPARVRIAGSEIALEGRVVVMATGAEIELACKQAMVEHPTASAIAIRRYVKSSVEIKDIVLTYDRSLVPGYAWIIPLGQGEYNVGCGVRLYDGVSKTPNLKKMLRQFLASFPLGQELEKGKSDSSKIEGAALRCGLQGCRQIVRENLVLIGEVIGTTFPFTGEGIGKAMHTGELAANAISAALQENDLSRLQAYSKAVKREIAPFYKGYLKAERWLSRPWLNDFVARRVAKSRYLLDELERIVAETGDPRSTFGLGGLLKSYWK